MKDKIIEKIKEIEKDENVKVLYAVESGSRAWGFESTDSDYDVRFIYAHSLEWYISLEEKRDVITYPVNDLLDFHGWDIRKALSLYSKSNPSLYEWLVSPIIYQDDGNFANQLRDMMSKFYSVKTSMSNYLHMADGEHRNYLQGEKVKLKDYFYVLRPIFACMWIEKYKTQPPMEFSKTMEAINLENELKDQVKKLLEKKRTGEEKDSDKRIELLNQFSDNKIKHFQEYAKNLVPEDKQDSSVLDKLLFDILKKS